MSTRESWYTQRCRGALPDSFTLQDEGQSAGNQHKQTVYAALHCSNRGKTPGMGTGRGWHKHKAWST
eukprot:1154367-Pelagomonas_calceolata.AAC.7